MQIGGTHGTTGPGNDQRLARFRLTDLGQARPGGQAEHLQHTERPGRIFGRLSHIDHTGAVRQGTVLPAAESQNVYGQGVRGVTAICTLTLREYSNFLILPLVAFFNAGNVFYRKSFDVTTSEVSGVMAGLSVCLPLGIVFICWVVVKLGIARLPTGVTWRHLIGGGCLAGIDFTMSIFIAVAAFDSEPLNASDRPAFR